MSETQQNDYTRLYILRQEQLLFDQIRKTIDAEIKASMLIKSSSELQIKYNESQKQVETQNEMMQQAANSIEDLTNRNKRLEAEKQVERDRFLGFNKKYNEANEERNNLHARNTSLQKEVERLNIEVNDLSKNISELDKNQNPKQINKKKQVKPVYTVAELPIEENTF